MSRGEGSPWSESTNLLGRSCHWCYCQPLLAFYFGIIIPAGLTVLLVVSGGP